MKNKPLVSIIMPSYNVKKYIAQSIKSVLSQTFKDWELIVIDDCSSDGTIDIINKFAKVDSRIKIIFRKENGGRPSISKNEALKYLRGEYIAFLDSDDLWCKEKLSKQIEVMKNSPFKLCYTGGYFINEKGNNIGNFLPKYKNGYIFRNMFFRYEINNQSVLITRDVFRKFNENIVIGEDYNLFMDIVYNYPVCSLKEHLIKYRIHKNSITKSRIIDLSDGILATLRELNSRYDVKKKYPIGYFLNLFRAYRFKILFYINNFMRKCQ